MPSHQLYGGGDDHAAEMMGGKRAKTTTTRKLSAYNKFVRECAKSASGHTRSGKDMMKHCAAQWKKLSASQKAAYK